MSAAKRVVCPECGVSILLVAGQWLDVHDIGVDHISAPAEGRQRCPASLTRVDATAAPRTEEVPATGVLTGPVASAIPGQLCGSDDAEVATMQRRRLPSELMSAGEARRIVRHLFTQTGHVELIDNAQLLVSEIVTSALYGAHTSVELRCTVEELGARVEVTVGQALVPPQRPPVATGIDGRGVVLLDRLAHRWGVTETDSGRTVWFVLAAMPPLDSDEPPSLP